MRIALLDPPSFTVPYDHALASALARRGHDVTLLTAPFTHGDVPEPEGYRREEIFLPVSSRLVRRSPRSRARLVLKGLEYAPSAARLLRRVRTLDPDVAHVQWLAIPRYDVHWLRRLRRAARADRARRAAAARAQRRRLERGAGAGGAGDRPVGAGDRAAGGGRRPAREARADPAPGLRERRRGHAAERPDDPLLRPDPRVQGPRRAPARAGRGARRAARRRRRPARPGRAAAAPGGRARRRRPRRVAARLPARRGDSAR